MYQQVIDARGGQVELQALPVFTIIERHLHSPAGAGIEQAGMLRVLAHDIDVSPIGQTMTDFPPVLASVVGDIGTRLEIVQPMPVNREIGRFRVHCRGIDQVDPAPVFQTGGRDIVPPLAAIAGHEHPAVIGADPDQPVLQWRGSNAEYRPIAACGGPVEGRIFATGGGWFMGGVGATQVGANGLPALATVIRIETPPARRYTWRAAAQRKWPAV